MVEERGQEDWDSEFGRFPRLFQGHEEIPGLTRPTTTFSERMTVWLGKRRVDALARLEASGQRALRVGRRHPDELDTSELVAATLAPKS